MFLGLLVVRLSYTWMTEEAFLTFIELLFYVMLSSVASYPLVQKLWHSQTGGPKTVISKNLVSWSGRVV